jgi:hypothetical protein
MQRKKIAMNRCIHRVSRLALDVDITFACSALPATAPEALSTSHDLGPGSLLGPTVTTVEDSDAGSADARR